ncbi:MAG TPA: hypothetical protein VNX26_00050 [Candidatus Acidoferrum sp.]|jgi:hypothetical protein|nr:hypothetical protein [Candidatus Acidoferrum sp.]
MLLRQIISEQLLATPTGAKFDVRNTLFFKILRANPLLARFYADLFRRHGANPSLIKDLETLSTNFFAPDQPTTKTKKGSNMAVNPNTRVCSHIKVNGIRCGSPSLRQEVFCYFHQRMIRGVRTPPKSRLHPMANFESQEAIQASLMEVVNALVRNHIDVPRARLILRALSIAARHANRVRFDCFESDMVKEVPQYPAAPPVAGPFAIATTQAAALTTISTPPPEESEVERLSSAFRPASVDVRRRKRPTSVKTTARARAASRSRAG